MPPAPTGGAKAAGYRPRNAGAGDPSFGAPTASETAELKRRARQRDKADAERYTADDPKTGPSAGQGGPQKGGGGTKVRQVRPANVFRGRPTAPGGTVVEEGAGFLLGLVLYALVLSYIKYGPDGVRGWLAAKFFNRPYNPPGAAPPPTSPFAPSPAYKPAATTTSTGVAPPTATLV
ncbi:MAG: hypothetical protein JWP02_1503 [Acidimicrobiales bacterium]|nr:hypothetical protein [Acidimicrobiales bacterium]